MPPAAELSDRLRVSTGTEAPLRSWHSGLRKPCKPAPEMVCPPTLPTAPTWRTRRQSRLPYKDFPPTARRGATGSARLSRTAPTPRLRDSCSHYEPRTRRRHHGIEAFCINRRVGEGDTPRVVPGGAGQFLSLHRSGEEIGFVNRKGRRPVASPHCGGVRESKAPFYLLCRVVNTWPQPFPAAATRWKAGSGNSRRSRPSRGTP